MKVTFLTAAANELHDAFDYYENELTGLGEKFQTAVRNSINRIIKFPNSYSKIGKYARRCLVNKFPYGGIPILLSI